MQTDAKPPRYANRKCGIGDGGENNLGRLGGWDSHTSQYMASSISRASTSKWTRVADFTRLEISTGKRKRCSRAWGGRDGGVPCVRGTALGLPPHQPAPAWKAVSMEHKVKREPDVPLSPHRSARQQGHAVWFGRAGQSSAGWCKRVKQFLCLLPYHRPRYTREMHFALSGFSWMTFTFQYQAQRLSPFCTF